MSVEQKFSRDKDKDWIEIVPIGVGLRMYILWNRQQPMPLGFVWGQTLEVAFFVYGSYTLPFARRTGVRTAINKQILIDHKRVVTCSGTDDGGLEFLKSQGYAFDDMSGFWCKKRDGET